jgi:hypothetical protein
MDRRALPENLREALALRHESNSRESGTVADQVGEIAAALQIADAPAMTKDFSQHHSRHRQG